MNAWYRHFQWKKATIEMRIKECRENRESEITEKQIEKMDERNAIAGKANRIAVGAIIISGIAVLISIFAVFKSYL